MVLVSARCSQYVIDCNSGKGSCCDVINCTSSFVNGVTSSAEGLQSSSWSVFTGHFDRVTWNMVPKAIKIWPRPKEFFRSWLRTPCYCGSGEIQVKSMQLAKVWLRNLNHSGTYAQGTNGSRWRQVLCAACRLILIKTVWCDACQTMWILHCSLRGKCRLIELMEFTQSHWCEWCPWMDHRWREWCLLMKPRPRRTVSTISRC